MAYGVGDLRVLIAQAGNGRYTCICEHADRKFLAVQETRCAKQRMLAWRAMPEWEKPLS